jgi:hypothetical protein
MAEEWGIRALHLRWARGAYFKIPCSSVVTALQVVYLWLSIPLPYVFSTKNRNKEVLPNSSTNNYVLIFKEDYHSLGPVSTLTKNFFFSFQKMNLFLHFELMYFFIVCYNSVI